jgi:hypothetical protein
MSPVPEKKHGRAGTVRWKRRGSWAAVAELPTTDRIEEESEDEASSGRLTEVMITCGTP